MRKKALEDCDLENDEGFERYMHFLGESINDLNEYQYLIIFCLTNFLTDFISK